MRDSGLVENRVSAVTPVYNGEKHLARFLDSILAQSWDEIEMILVDDGSTDGTLEAARAYQEKFRARGFDYRIIAAGHKNASAAINRGLREITGEFLIWPDSDDALARDSVRKRVEFLQANAQYQCVRSLSAYVLETGERAAPDEKRGDIHNERLFFPILESETFVCCGCYMLRTERFFEIYPRRRIPEYDVGQNFQMLLPFMYFHPCPTIPEELYTVYIRAGSHSRRKLTQREERQKYASYEDLIDDLAHICGITDEAELRRISLWKERRRFQFYSKYGIGDKAAAAFKRIYACRGVTLRGFVKGMVKILCGPKIHRLWLRLRHGGLDAGDS